jgi:hypothetical protein
VTFDNLEFDIETKRRRDQQPACPSLPGKKVRNLEKKFANLDSV